MSEALISWFLTNVVLPLAATFLLAAASKAVLVINKKFNLDIQRTTVENAVHYAEQMAATAIKNNQAALTSSQKLNKAVEYVNKAIPGQDQERVKQRIESAVQRISLNCREPGNR